MLLDGGIYDGERGEATFCGATEALADGWLMDESIGAIGTESGESKSVSASL